VTCLLIRVVCGESPKVNQRRWTKVGHRQLVQPSTPLITSVERNCLHGSLSLIKPCWSTWGTRVTAPLSANTDTFLQHTSVGGALSHSLLMIDDKYHHYCDAVLLTVITVLRLATVQRTDIPYSDDSNNTAIVTRNCSLLWKRSKTTNKRAQWMTDVRRFGTALWSQTQKSSVEEKATRSFKMTPRSPETSDSSHPAPRCNILNEWTHLYWISFTSCPLWLHDGAGIVDRAATLCSVRLTDIRV
jgi:hypothetical protein